MMMMLSESDKVLMATDFDTSPIVVQYVDEINRETSPDLLNRTISTTASDHHIETDEVRNEMFVAGWKDEYTSRSHAVAGDLSKKVSLDFENGEAIERSLKQQSQGFEKILNSARVGFPEGRVVGVYFDKQRRIWRANWREGGVGKRKTKNFSVDDYGFEEARRLAIQYRLLKIMEVSDKQMTNGGSLELFEAAEHKRKSERKNNEKDFLNRKRRKYSSSIKLNMTTGCIDHPETSNTLDVPSIFTSWPGVEEDRSLINQTRGNSPGNTAVYFLPWRPHWGNGNFFAPPPPPYLVHTAAGAWHPHQVMNYIGTKDILEGTAANSAAVVSSVEPPASV